MPSQIFVYPQAHKDLPGGLSKFFLQKIFVYPDTRKIFVCPRRGAGRDAGKDAGETLEGRRKDARRAPKDAGGASGRTPAGEAGFTKYGPKGFEGFAILSTPSRRVTGFGKAGSHQPL